jgi:hypothetical protein
MDSRQFDALSRSLATAGTRRSFMRLLGAPPLVGTLAAVFAGDTVAQGRRGTRRGPRGRTQAAGRSRHSSPSPSPDGAAHAETNKREKREKREKRKKRKPLQSPPLSPSGCTPRCDRKVCGDDGCGGRCGSCDADQVCADGRCASSCPGGRKACSGECIPSNQCCISSDCPAAIPACCGGECVPDLTSNARHCGICAMDCTALAHAARSTCSAGTCVLVCDTGYADCNTEASDGCEVDTQTDAAHCGSCPHACGSGQPCVDGQCVPPPPPPCIPSVGVCSPTDTCCASGYVCGSNGKCCGQGGSPCGVDSDCCECFDGFINRCSCNTVGGYCVESDIG